MPSTIGYGPPYASPARTAHVPDTAIAAAVVRVRPQESPSTPPAQQPSAPTPITANVAMAAARPPDATPSSARLSVKNARNHAHMAYSSHMCPKYPIDASRTPRFVKTCAAWRGSNVARANGNGPSCTAKNASTAPAAVSADVDEDHVFPPQASRSVHEVRERGSEGERADHDAERDAAAALVPRRHDLQRHRVHAGEQRSRRKAKAHRQPRSVGQCDAGVGGGRAQRRDPQDAAGRIHIGEVQQRGDHARRRRTRAAQRWSAARLRLCSDPTLA